MSSLHIDTPYLNADLQQRVVIKPSQYHWIESPISGVDRMRLDRINDKVDRVTTIVRFVPNSQFSPHTHEGGEEFFVLEGVFSDEHRDYPAGTYVRNPIGTAHTPNIGKEGAMIFVKLEQFDSADTEQKTIDTNTATWQKGSTKGLKILPLHSFESESVSLVQWAPNTLCPTDQCWGGKEILVLSGTFYDEYGEYPKGSWIRSPHLSKHTPYTKKESTIIYVKTGHLPPSSIS